MIIIAKVSVFISPEAELRHVRWVPCHHGMARPQVADGGDALQFWMAAANILNYLIPRRCPGISWTLVVKPLAAACSFPSITSAINCCRRHIRVYGTVA
jgi:hypothetical protein